MSGFTEKRASDASEQPGGEPVVLTWGAAGAMLPLVERIAADVVRSTTVWLFCNRKRTASTATAGILLGRSGRGATGCKRRRPMPRKNCSTRLPSWKCWGWPCCTALPE